MKQIRLDGTVGWEILAEDIAREIDGESQIEVVINSGGGDILEGFSIFNLLNEFPGSVHVKVDYAGSMASVIAMAGDTIEMADNSSILMIHRPWGSASGNSEDLRKIADTLDKLEVMLVDVYANKTGIDREAISQMLDDETYMSAVEAKEFGFIDTVTMNQVSFELVAMAGMKSTGKVDFSTDKFLAKIQSMKNEKPKVKEIFNACETLADIESKIRSHFKVSQAEATAIVAAVKKHVQGDLEQKEMMSLFNNFKF